MKFIWAIILFLSVGAAAQMVNGPIAVNGAGVPYPQQVTVCTTNPGGATCPSLATLYTTIGLTTACSGTGVQLNASSATGCSNPGFADNAGNVIAYTPVGQYWCQYSGSGIIPYSRPCPSHNASSAVNPASVVQNIVYVDGIVHASLAAAAYDPLCFNSFTNGCKIIDNLPEIFQASPLPGSGQYTVELGPGSGATSSNADQAKWRSTVPLVFATDRVKGGGYPNSTASNGTTATIIKACKSDTTCSTGSLYFPARGPAITATPTLTATNTGSLSAGTYFFEWVPLVNLNTAADATATDSLPTFPASTAVKAGVGYTDGLTNCSAAACTQVVVTPGTTGASAPAWNPTFTGLTVSGTAVFENIGRYASAAAAYGSVGYGMAGPESSGIAINGTSQTSFTTVAPASSAAYPVCNNTTTYTTGNMVQNAAGTHLYRAIAIAGGVAATQCLALSTVAGSQTTDVANSLYWQEVGPITNFLPQVGYIPYVTSGASGSEVSQAVSGAFTGTNTCSATVQVANQIACAPGATMTINSISATNRPTPLADTSAPLVVMEDVLNNNTASSVDNPNTRLENLLLDANNIAAEGLLNNAGQEGSGCFTCKILGGDEAPVVQLGANSQNSILSDMNIGNESTVGGTKFMQRVAGCIFADARAGAAVKRVEHVTCVPQQAPSNGINAEALYCNSTANGECGTWTGLHVENTTDAFYQVGGNASVDGLDLSTTNVTNAIHIGSTVTSLSAKHIRVFSTDIAVQDDTISAGTGNCNSTNSLCSTAGASGDYILGGTDSSSNRQRISNIAGMANLNNGGLTINGAALQPATVAGAGTAAPSILAVTGAAGGGSSGNTGGNGSPVTITMGGGTQGGATFAGGAAGVFTFTGATGGAGGATSGTGGAGSDFLVTTGTGGAATAGSTTGRGGNVTFTLGGPGGTGTRGNPGVFTIAGNTLPANRNVPFLNITGTWNTTGVVDAGIFENVTNTASGSGSMLMDLQASTVSQFSVASQASNSFALGPNLALGGTAPTITLPGTTPFLALAGLTQASKNTCDWALTAQSSNAVTSLCSTAITLPASAQKWHFWCSGVWQVSASTTPTVTMGVTFAQAPSATGLIAGKLSSTNGSISTAPTAISGSVVSLASGNNNIVAAQTITPTATYFPFQLNGWFTSNATSGTWSPTITVGTSASTWATAGECIVF